jgi:hypothetical protein
MIQNRRGLTFQIHKAQQIKVESTFRTKNLVTGNQTSCLENLSKGTIKKLTESELGLTKPEMITNGGCLFLEEGLYRWSQEITSNVQPDFINYDYGAFITNFDNFGLGGPYPSELLNSGTDNIYTLMSSIEGRNVYARGKVFYDLLDNEELFVEVKVIDLTTGIIIGTGNATAEGNEQGEIETGVVPYITKAGHVFEITLKLKTNATNKQNCLIIQHG